MLLCLILLLLFFLKIAHEDVYDEVLSRLKRSFSQVMERIGDPIDC